MSRPEPPTKTQQRRDRRKTESAHAKAEALTVEDQPRDEDKRWSRRMDHTVLTQRQDQRALPCACQGDVPCLAHYGAMNLNRQLEVRRRLNLSGKRDR